MLAWLAIKGAGALPGIIGMIVSRLFKTAIAAVGWLAQNMWAPIPAVGGLLYVLVVEHFKNRKSGSYHHKSNSANKKSHKD